MSDICGGQRSHLLSDESDRMRPFAGRTSVVWFAIIGDFLDFVSYEWPVVAFTG